MTTVNIPAHTFAARAAPYTIGPYAVPEGVSSFALSANVAQAMGAGNSFYVSIERRIGGGAWERFSGFGETGGYAGDDPLGCSADFYGEGGERYQFPDMDVRMVIDVTGAALANSGGSLVVT